MTCKVEVVKKLSDIRDGIESLRHHIRSNHITAKSRVESLIKDIDEVITRLVPAKF